MEAFKIEHFSKVHNGLSFPWFHSLTVDEKQLMQNRLLKKLSMTEDKNTLNLVCTLSEIGKVHQGFNAQDKNFDLIKVFESLGIHTSDCVYINWYRFDQVDKIKLVDLAKYFDDIWYPSSDDLDIFDDNLSWFISISHEGEVRSVLWST